MVECVSHLLRAGARAVFAVVCGITCCSCAAPDAHRLTYTVRVSDAIPRRITIQMALEGWRGPYLDLRGHSPSNVMQIEDLEVRARDGSTLRWVERPETIRVAGQPVRRSTYRVEGPLPASLTVRYRVSPGRREGDAHLGFTNRCFGYLGETFAVLTGRDVFLLPDPVESIPRIRVAFRLPKGWKAVAPWRATAAGFEVTATHGRAAERLAATTVGLGRFSERTFDTGRTRVRLALVEPIADGAAAERAVGAMQHAARYVRGTFGRDIGREYLALVAPETPDGLDIVGGGWTDGQGRTLLPLSVERLRGFAEDLIRVYVRYPSHRTEIRIPEEYWLVDAIAQYYSRRAVVAAGMGSVDAIARSEATGYLITVSGEGGRRNLEGAYGRAEGDQSAREAIGPFLLLLVDHELRGKHGVAHGLDAVVPRFLSGRFAPSFWSLLPGPSTRWDFFRAEYVRGTAIAAAPDLFTAPSTRPAPVPPGGPPVARVTLAYTGNTEGYLENCGCKANESGGIARRATVLDSLRRVDPDLVVLDAGNAFDRPDQFQSPNALADREQRIYLELMDRLGYAAAAVGLGELDRGPTYFREQTRGIRTPFLSANVAGSVGRFGRPTTRLRANGRWIAVIGVFEPPQSGRSQLHIDRELARLTIEDPVRAVAHEVRAARERGDLILVIGTLSPLTVRRLVRAYPEVDVVISTDSSLPRWAEGQPARHRVILTDDPSGFLGRTLVLYTHMGQYGLSIARLDLDRTGAITAASLRDAWLPDAVRDQAGVRRALNAFYDRVGSLPEAQAGVRPPLAGDPYWRGKRYVGAAACRECHGAEFAQWKSTAHAGAYKTLLDKHRHYQPVCLSCHVVGFGSTSGYRVGQGEEPFGNVQCEVCHGPGAAHVEDPDAPNIRKEVPESVCRECHNPEHSDRFVYATKLPRVEHRAETVASAHP